MDIGKRCGLGAAALALTIWAGTARAGQRPNIMEGCKVCHTPAEGVVRGKLVSVAPAQRSLNVTVGPLVWIVKYGDDLKVKEGAKVSGPDALKKIPRDREIAVSFTGPESRAVATQVAVKQPYKVAPEKLVTVDQVKALVAKGTGPGNVLLVDSRPPPMYADGHIPGAVSLPYGAFKEKAGAVLPADKAAAVVFYCAGET